MSCVRMLLTLVLVLASFSAAAASDRPYRIYVITFRGLTDVEKGFEAHFRSSKIPVEIIYRDLARDSSRLPGFIDEIRRIRPDLVYTWGTSVTLGVVGAYDQVDPARHITDIPVVFTLVAAPVLARITPNLKSSGRNVTGVFHVAPPETQMRAMSSYRPFTRVGVLYTSTEQNSLVTLKELRAVGSRLGFSVTDRAFRLNAEGKPTAEGAAELVNELHRDGAQWLYLPPDSFLGTQAQKVVIPAAMGIGLPTFASTEQLMETGALAGLVSRYFSIGQFTGYKAEQILRAKRAPSDIPIETLSRFSFQVRLPAAKQLNLPPSLGLFNYAEILSDEVKKP